ncbi:unnamed protein product [Citrullus colocynthis]|uniref:Uncharacterized protein n=1 Tax=Citrullus colocynthis TaxID=252529 RepID=A0ABP0ZC84_9ROSI
MEQKPTYLSGGTSLMKDCHGCLCVMQYGYAKARPRVVNSFLIKQGYVSPALRTSSPSFFNPSSARSVVLPHALKTPYRISLRNGERYRMGNSRGFGEEPWACYITLSPDIAEPQLPKFASQLCS